MADTVTGTLSSSSSKYHVQPSLLPPATQNVRTFEQALSGEQTGRAKPAFPTPEQYQEALSWSEGQSLESAKARMAFVRPLVEAIIPDIQGIGDNAAKAQQSWSNGQYLSATEAVGGLLIGAMENIPALKAGKVIGKSDNLYSVDARERAQEIHSVLDSRAQRQRTTAVTETEEGVRIISSSERDLSSKQKSILQLNEIAAKGDGHAEVTGVNTAKDMGFTPTGTAASRPICQNCAVFLNENSVQPLSPLKDK